MSRLAARSSGVIDRIASLMPDELIEDLLAESLDERIETLAGVGRRGSRTRAGRGSARRGRAGASRGGRAGATRRSRRAPCGSGCIMSGVLEAALHAGTLLGHDVLELAPDVPSTSPRSYRSRSSSRRRASRSIRSWSPAMSRRVGSPLRQPRSISRRSASPRSPSAITSSDSALRISSASRSGSRWVPSQREYPCAPGSSASRSSSARGTRPPRSRGSGE